MDPPNYADEVFTEIRQNLVAALNMTDEEAVEHLTAAWRQRNPAQPPLDQADAQPPRHAIPAPPPIPAIGDAPPPEDPPGTEKKKHAPKIKKGSSLPTTRTPDPSEHAIRKLRNFEYVELWYFTPKGCEAAAAHAIALDSDTFTISKTDSNLTLLPSRASSLPKNAIIQDQNLTYNEMSVAKNTLIVHMDKCGWPKDVVRMFMDFYVLLDTHAIRSQPQGDQAILIYQAEARKEWHRDLAVSKDQETFDLADINKTRLQEIADAIRISMHNQLITGDCD